MNRIILHIDMDYFFAQIEERENPRFKGKPVVVGADPKPEQIWYGAGPKGEPIIKMIATGRGVVSTANYEARKYGIKSAMPISKAYQLCPNAIFLPVNIEFYQKVSEKIMEIVKKYSPRWEIVSLDEAYLDLSTFYAAARNVESWREIEKVAKKLKEEILEKEKLTSTVGIGPNKLVAKMASKKAKPRSESNLYYGAKPRTRNFVSLRGRPDGLLIIKPNQVRKFLEPLGIEDLPGIGPKTSERLRALKVNKIKDLKKISKLKLKKMFGKVGEAIYQKAKGIDETPVISEEIIKSIGKEHTFERDTKNPEIIFGKFDEIIKEVYNEISSGNFHFKTITVICRFQGFETHTKSKTLETPIRDLEIFKKEAKNLLLRFLIENPKLIRLIGLRVKIH